MRKLVVLFFVILLFSLTGCEDNENIEMIKHMNDKYTDDTFTYDGVFGGGAGTDTETIIVSSKNYPDKDIYVRHNYNDDDIYTDNYLGVKFEEQTEAAIRNVLDAVIPYEYLLFYEVDRYACPNSVGTLTFEEYLASENACIGFTVVINGVVSEKDSFEKVFEETIVDKGICCSGTVYFDNDSGAFDLLELDGLSGYTFNGLYNDVFSFEMNNNKEFSVSQWGE